MIPIPMRLSTLVLLLAAACGPQRDAELPRHDSLERQDMPSKDEQQYIAEPMVPGEAVLYERDMGHQGWRLVSTKPADPTSDKVIMVFRRTRKP